MLKRLVESDSTNFSKTIIVSLTSLGEIGGYFRDRGVFVHALGMRSLIDFPITLWRMIQLLRYYKPAIVHTWMYHANLLGGAAAKIVGFSSVVWGIHSVAIPQGMLSPTYWLVRLGALFSYFIPNRIVCCANSAKTTHIKLHYAAHNMTVIPNGYDFSAFDRDPNLMQKARLELGFVDADIVVGVVGRFDPLKDFHNFVTAASFMAAKRGDVKFLMVGRGNEWSNDLLREWIEVAGLSEQFKLVGQQTNVAYYLSAMDIFCLSSVSEAFPNVVVEAMAIGLPCVVTRAGDAADILGNDDFVVPVKDSAALATVLLRMCNLNPVVRTILGEENAKKVREEYGIEKIRQKYEEIYDQVSRK
jgi:glycosyltransferase involved in cell wall biosynthesis